MVTASEMSVQPSPLTSPRMNSRSCAEEGQTTRELGNLRVALRTLRGLYGGSKACEFGPRALKAVREALVNSGHSRGYVNQNVGRIRRVFRWGAAEELVPASVHHSLQAVEGLKRGRTAAPETEPVRPIDDAQVDAIESLVSRQVWALIQLQRFSGARPGEFLRLRPCDVDRSSGVWVYTPRRHKTQHHGHARRVLLGPRSQEVLEPFLRGRLPASFCFSPREAEEERRAEQHAQRTTPLSCGNRPGSNRKKKPSKTPNEHSNRSSRSSITR